MDAHFTGKKLNEQRNEVLKRLADLKQEMRELEATFTEKNKKYESIKAYSKVSALEVNLELATRLFSSLSYFNVFEYYEKLSRHTRVGITSRHARVSLPFYYIHYSCGTHILSILCDI